MTLGQEFTAFGHTMLEDVDRLGEAQALIREINMGATAIGTGHQRAAGLRRGACASICRASRGCTLITAPDLVEATADTGAFVQLSRRAQALRGEALEDLQRPAAAQLRPARRTRRDQPAADAARLVDHAGQGESGHSRSGEPGLLRRHRRRRHGDDGGRGGPAAAQRVRAGDRVSAAARHRRRSTQRVRRAARAVRRRASRRIPIAMRQFVEHSIGIVTALVPVIGYETRDVGREGSARERARRVRRRDGARAADARAARPRARSRRDDRPRRRAAVARQPRAPACPPPPQARSTPRAFDLPVEQIKQGFYTDAYFVRAREIAARREGESPRVPDAVHRQERGLARRHRRSDRDAQALRRRLERARR